ncbi:NTP transferase domain-containing protein [Colwelliaceae bacterium 6441]
MTNKIVNTYNQNCLGVVLSGGLSSRMGKDKALLERKFNSEKADNMLSFSGQQLKEAGVDDVIISGKQHGIADEYENLGPMGGIYTIIEKYHPKALLVLPVDLPLMDSESLAQLKRVGELSQQSCFYQDNYLPLYLPINAYVEQFFQQAFLPLKNKHHLVKGPSIRALIKQIPHQCLIPKNAQSLFNANTPEQWQQAKQQFQKNRKKHV